MTLEMGALMRSASAKKAASPWRKWVMLSVVYAAASTLWLGSVPARAQTITTVAGQRGCDNDSLKTIIGEAFALDSAGNTYFTAGSGGVICKKDAVTGKLSYFAGTGEIGNSGDGGLATQAKIGRPNAMVVDSANNLFFTSDIGYRVRKITPQGIISTVAGTGESGYNGDGIPAISAQINGANALAVDGVGNLYVGTNGRVRKIDTQGIISTVVGTGAYGRSGNGGPATQATIEFVRGVLVDGAGQIYFSSGTDRVRMVDAQGIIHHFAGSSSADPYGEGFSGDGGLAVNAQLNWPAGLAKDAAGNVYISDSNNLRVRKVDTAGTITTVAGGGADLGDTGAATALQLSNVGDVKVDASNRLWIRDGGRIRILSASGVANTAIGAGLTDPSEGGPAILAQLPSLGGIVSDGAGNIFTIISGEQRVRRVGVNGLITTVLGRGASTSGTPTVPFNLGSAKLLAVDGLGNLYISQPFLNVIHKLDANGVLSTFAGNGSRSGGGDGQLAVNSAIGQVRSMVADQDGNLYYTLFNRVKKVDTNGILSTVAGDTPEAGQDGGFRGDGGPALQALLSGVDGIALDSAGNVLVSDGWNNRIRKIDTNGIITTIAGTGEAGFGGDGGPATSAQLAFPTSLAVDDWDNIYVFDSAYGLVRMIDTSGVIHTLAGNGQGISSGDNGPAIYASFAQGSKDITVDPYGNVFVADANYVRLRKITLAATSEPQNVTAALKDGVVTVSWEAPAELANTIVLSYQVTGAPGGSCTATAPQTSCTITGLTSGQSYTFTVVAINGAGASFSSLASNAVSTAPGLSFTAPTTIASAQVGQAYSLQLTASGGSGSYRYALASGKLPAGLALSEQGRITGTPTAAGAFTVGVKATDTKTGASKTVSFTLTVEAADTSGNCGNGKGHGHDKKPGKKPCKPPCKDDDKGKGNNGKGKGNDRCKRD